MRRVLIRAAVFGASFALTFGLFTLLVLWYLSRTKPLAPWDKTAITAEFDRLGTEEDDHYPSFAFVLQNNTDHDYELIKTSLIPNAKLLNQNSLSTIDDDHISIRLPVFLPSKQRSRLVLYLKYEFPDTLRNHFRSVRKREDGIAIIKKYLDEEIYNLNGFVLFDKHNRYEITLPRGW